MHTPAVTQLDNLSARVQLIDQLRNSFSFLIFYSLKITKRDLKKVVELFETRIVTLQTLILLNRKPKKSKEIEPRAPAGWQLALFRGLRVASG